ncbi:MAG: right-handed parallel beta-helix repeat-containing protein [bacterium]|nr:right-handed parallel beta-helix repeat-containing protein [bacterium]MDT8365024.1 right-handed parallel beta-helix repeat-containing protein [bacterium]
MDRAACILLFIVAALPSCAAPHSVVMTGDVEKPIVLAETVTTDTTVSGKVTIAQDLLVPEGITLTFLPGTQVTVVPSEGTRTDSQFVTTQTEIVVRGSLLVDGTTVGTQNRSKGFWGGIIAATPEADITIRGSRVAGAQYGLMMLHGTARVTNSTFENNEVGIAAALGAWVELADNTFDGNSMATAAWHTANPLRSPTDTFTGNEDGALALTAEPMDIQFREILPVIQDTPPITREYLGEVALTEDTSWSGTVVVEGQVAVMPEATLTIEAGTHVLFSPRDTNSDGLGESWIIVQGTVQVLGEEDDWVLFDAQDQAAGPGAWDSLSIIASDSTDNLVQYAVFRRGVKAFHTHFSKVRLDHAIFEDNLRGIQFQESESTRIDRVILRRNQSGARFRDSEVNLSNVAAIDNVAGINFLRSSVTASDIFVTGSFTESFVSRESETTLNRAVITGNVRGPRFKGDGENVSIREAAVMGNLTEGLSLNNVKATVRESRLTGNGFTGLSVTDAEVTAYGNRIAGNGRFEVDNNGSTVVDARGNDWGTGSGPAPEMIYDGSDEGGIGQVLTADPRRFLVLFPGMNPPREDLEGDLLVVGDVITSPETTVRLTPGTSVFFSEVPQDSLFDLCSDHPSFPSSELHVMGKLEAVGTMDNPITFAPARRTMFELNSEEGPGRAQWGAVNLTGGQGAVFENCYIFRAATGIHARDAGKVIVRDSVFISNDMALRFSRSDVEITGNAFELNNTGMRFHKNGGIVSGNLFDSNATGIFVTDNPENVTLTGNTFKASRDYHIKLGILVTEDVEVRGGLFDLSDGKTLRDMVFDREDDGDLGMVIILP